MFVRRRKKRLRNARTRRRSPARAATWARRSPDPRKPSRNVARPRLRLLPVHPLLAEAVRPSQADPHTLVAKSRGTLARSRALPVWLARVTRHRGVVAAAAHGVDDGIAVTAAARVVAAFAGLAAGTTTRRRTAEQPSHLVVLQHNSGGDARTRASRARLRNADTSLVHVHGLQCREQHRGAGLMPRHQRATVRWRYFDRRHCLRLVLTFVLKPCSSARAVRVQVRGVRPPKPAMFCGRVLCLLRGRWVATSTAVSGSPPASRRMYKGGHH